MTDDLRARIARLVFPDAWRSREAHLRAADASDQTSEEQRRIWRGRADELVKPSLDKADAILDLIAERIANVEAERDGAREQLTAWFDTSKKADDDITPDVKGAFAGYLRTCRVGGLPSNVSSTAQELFEDFADKYLGQTLTPHIEARATAAEAERDAALAKLEEAREVVRPLASCEWPEGCEHLPDSDGARYFIRWGEIRAARAFIGGGS